MNEAEYPIVEVSGGSQLTERQQDRLKALDWYIEELGVVMEENKTYGVLQANWRHRERFENWLVT